MRYYPQRRSMTARVVTSSVNPRQRRGTSADADAPRTRRRWHSPAHLFENSVHLSHSFRIESKQAHLRHAQQWQSMTARAVTSSVNPRQRRGTSADADAPRTRRHWHTPAAPRSGGGRGIIEKKLCESKYCCNFVVMESVCAPWSAIKRERRANRRQYPLL